MIHLVSISEVEESVFLPTEKTPYTHRISTNEMQVLGMDTGILFSKLTLTLIGTYFYIKGSKSLKN